MELFKRSDIYQALDLDRYGWLGNGIAGLLYKVIRGDQINSVYKKNKHLPPSLFLKAVLESWKVEYTLDISHAEIPNESPFIVVANHPTLADGLVMSRLFLEERKDFKIIGNFLMQRIEPIQPILLPVNPFEDRKDVFDSRQAFIKAVRHVKAGGCFGIFPAGEISKRKRNLDGQWEITDKEWEKSALKLISALKVPILPMLIEAKNPRWFYFLANIHPAIQTLMLPASMFNSKKKRLHIKFGSLIQPSEFSEMSEEEFSGFLRHKLYEQRA